MLGHSVPATANQRNL